MYNVHNTNTYTYYILLFLTLVIFPSTKTIFNLVVHTNFSYVELENEWKCKNKKSPPDYLAKKILAIYSLRQYLAEDFVELAQKFCFVCICMIFIHDSCKMRKIYRYVHRQICIPLIMAQKVTTRWLQFTLISEFYLKN